MSRGRTRTSDPGTPDNSDYLRSEREREQGRVNARLGVRWDHQGKSR
jgi:hypothetical protein